MTFSGNIVRNFKLEPNLGTQYAIRINGIRITAIGNQFENYYGRGVDMSRNAKECTIVGNLFVSNGQTVGSGIYNSSNGGRMRIANNEIQNSGGSGIERYASNDLVIEGNTIRNAAYYGISLTYCHRVVVNANVCVDNLREGILVSVGSDRVNVANNLICDTRAGAARTQQYGIRLVDSATNIELAHNQSYNNTTADIVYGTTPVTTIERGFKTWYSNSLPTTGAWKEGDKVVCILPGAAGHIGWICVSAGTFGATAPCFNPMAFCKLARAWEERFRRETREKG
ncbi:right-handed parallel beta-helix repeat-containing protein [Paenibacillus oceani]|uniref:Right-handed parallel beta-helix repeat-containing protein n=1 Tax=Paenibacillus oceani TaxID=2772510 RepID=A0A927C6N5_9BACL|nr:right-handed parallel beta-helix repeat-containing protein [Paenibacillus oceani]